ncbi:hypothetical protein ACWX0O_01995 [Nitrobacteraceae bacterium UC4449_H16]
MRTPAVVVLGPKKRRITAQLRPAGETARKIRHASVTEGFQNIAATRLIADEVRRSGYIRNGGWRGRRRIGTGKVKTTDTSGLMASRTGNVVQSPLESGDRANIGKRGATFRCPLQRSNDIAGTERRSPIDIRGLNQSEFRLHVRFHKTHRGRGNDRTREEFLRYEKRATVERAEMFGLQQPFREFGFEVGVCKKTVAIDLVFERRLVESSGRPIVSKNLHQIIGSEYVRFRLGPMPDLQVQFDPDQLRRLKQHKRPARFGQTADERGSRQRFIPHREPSPRDFGAGGIARCDGIGRACRSQHDIQGHWQTDRLVRARLNSHQPIDQPDIAARLRRNECPIHPIDDSRQGETRPRRIE